MAEDFLDDIPVYGNDIVINLNFLLVYKAHETTDFGNGLLKQEIKSCFKNYTFNNSIRIKNIRIGRNSIIFLIKQINPDYSLQDTIDDINKYLLRELKRFNITLRDDDWECVESYSVGNAKEVMKNVESYLKNLRIDDEQGINNLDTV